MTDKSEIILDQLLNAVFRPVKWKLITEHRWVMDDSFLEFLDGKGGDLLRIRDYTRLQALSKIRAVLLSAGRYGVEKALFGKHLDTPEREFVSLPLPSDLTGKLHSLAGLIRIEEWDVAFELLEPFSQHPAIVENPILSTELHSLLGILKLNTKTGNRVSNLRKAIDYSEKVLSINGKDILPVELGSVLKQKGIIYQLIPEGSKSKNIEKAISFNEQALGFLEKDLFPVEWAQIKNSLANAYIARLEGNYVENLETALDLYMEARSVFIGKRFPLYRAKLDHNIGILYMHRLKGDPAENQEHAIKFFKTSLRRRSRSKFPFMWALLQSNIAGLYLKRIRGNKEDNIEKGIRYSDRALSVFDSEKYPFDRALTIANKGYLMMQRVKGDPLNNVETAIGLIEQAMEVLSKDRYPLERANYLEGLVEANLIKSASGGDIDLKTCLGYCYSAYKVFTRGGMFAKWVKCKYFEGLLYFRGWKREKKRELLVKAENCINEAFSSLAPDSFPDLCVKIATDLSAVRMELGDLNGVIEAAAIGKDADRMLLMQATSLPGKSHRYENSSKLFFLAALACLRSDRPFDAIAWLEMGRLRELGSILERERAAFRGELREEHRKEYSRLVAELRTAEFKQREAGSSDEFEVAVEEAENIGGMLKELVTEIQNYVPDFMKETVKNGFELAGFAVGSDSVFIIYILSEHGTGTILLYEEENEHRFKSFFDPDCTTGTVKNLITEWRKCRELAGDWSISGDWRVRSKWWKLFDGFARQMFNRLFANVYRWIEENLPDNGSLTFVPHMELHELPLHLMRFDSDTGASYLIEKRNIRFTPALSIVSEIPRDDRSETKGAGPEQGGYSALIVSNPTGDLKWSGTEAERVISRIPGTVVLLKGVEATTSAVEMLSGDAPIMHFSCHAEFDTTYPMKSALLLAPDNKFGGVNPVRKNRHPDDAGNGEVSAERLSLADIFMKMECRRAELVVLSACETGVVKTGGMADEFIGLTGGFISRGAGAVVASLWAVDDMATSVLMDNFYRNLFENKMEASEALRKAQLEVKDTGKWKNPYYWGAFIIFSNKKVTAPAD